MAESKKKGEFITQLHKYDVLCGRGSGPNERAGNINFRDLVATRKHEYLAINTRDHKNKNRIAREIIEAVRSRGGRFLKRACVDFGDGDDTEAYELADETTVLEKAKQALRQNRTGRAELFLASTASTATSANMYGGSQSKVMEGTSHLPPQLNPYQYQAFISQFQQTNYSPAEAAIRNLQIQSFLAQQQHQCNSNHLPVNSMSMQNPSFATELGRFYHGHQRNATARQQYQPAQESSLSNRSVQPPVSSSSATYSDHLMFSRGQQMKQNGRNFSAVGGNAIPAPQGRDLGGKSISTANTNSQNPLSDGAFRVVENMFAGPSQNTSAARRDSGQINVTSTGEQSTKRDGSESLIEGLEDMSLPSMSIGEISDFSTQGPASLSRSKRSVGGTIVETTENSDSATDSADHITKTQDISVGTQEQIIADRHASFHGSEQASSNEGAAALESVHSAYPEHQLQRQPHTTNHVGNDSVALHSEAVAGSSKLKKKQRRSLSSYYREMKAAHSGCPSTMEGVDAMTLDPR